MKSQLTSAGWVICHLVKLYNVFFEQHSGKLTKCVFDQLIFKKQCIGIRWQVCVNDQLIWYSSLLTARHALTRTPML